MPRYDNKTRARFQRLFMLFRKYNDVCKAYDPNTFEPFYKKLMSVQERIPQKKNSSLALSDGDLLTDELFEKELQELLEMEKNLKTVCDPQSLCIPLWKEGNIPDMCNLPYAQIETFDLPDFVPNMVPYLLEDGKRHPAVIVLSGGARNNFIEGDPVCRFFNSIGLHAFLSGHRAGGQPYNYSLDLQRELRLIRYRADEFLVDPDRIAVCGMSMGGVVTVSYIEKFEYDDVPSRYDPSYVEDEIDQMPAHINAYINLYTSSSPHVVRDPYQNYSQYPPVFALVPSLDAAKQFQMGFLMDLITHGVRVELHLIDGIVHGCGLADGVRYPAGENDEVPEGGLMWPKLCEIWLHRIIGEF